MFLDFVNFYKRFIKNFSGIIAPLITIVQLTGHNNLSTLANGNKTNHNAPSHTGGSINNSDISESIENLSIIKNLTKFKKPDLARFKKLKLVKTRKLDFAIAQTSRTDFLTPKAKKTFIHLQKVFTKAPIF